MKTGQHIPGRFRCSGAFVVTRTQAPTSPGTEASTPFVDGTEPPGQAASRPGSACTSGALTFRPATVTVVSATAVPLPVALRQAVAKGDASTARLSRPPGLAPGTAGATGDPAALALAVDRADFTPDPTAPRDAAGMGGSPGSAVAEPDGAEAVEPVPVRPAAA